jgi:tRNA modification GTPase
MESDTIAAIATPVGSSGIGIVRISGPTAIDISKQIFLPHRRNFRNDKEKFFKSVRSHRLYYGYICDPKQNSVVDEVLMVLMKTPHSYTREDVIEIQSHSGSVILSKILQLSLECGARLAEPGEFTKRAFLNGRIDLSQAEAIADMISAKTEDSLKLAATHLTGLLRDKISGFIHQLKEYEVVLEASIEFPEDINGDIDYEKMAESVKKRVLDPIESLIHQYDDGHVLRDGIRLDIVGRPNVGKSSLLNAMIQRDKAIVTDLPGTTRDLIQDYTSIDGIPVILTDTAGIHDAKDPVEIIGIQKTKENIQKSDLVLWVVDGGSGVVEEDHLIYEQITNMNALLVINKLDLTNKEDFQQVPLAYQHMERIFVSAKFGDGLLDLKKAIKRKCLNDVHIDTGRSLVPNFRQKSALERAHSFISQVIQGLNERQTEDLIVADLAAAKKEIGTITGDNINGDLLDEIFGKFCIGK